MRVLLSTQRHFTFRDMDYRLLYKRNMHCNGDPFHSPDAIGSRDYLSSTVFRRMRVGVYAYLSVL
jgi:hypothetical protein